MAGVVFPVETVLESACAVHQFVVTFAGCAEIFSQGKAALDRADSSCQFVVGKAFNANSSGGLQTSARQLLASSVLGDEETTFTRNAAVVIESLAVGDVAVIVFKHEGFVTLLA